MSWHVGEKPRSPRHRATNRLVPQVGAGSEVYAVPPAYVTDAQLSRILSTLPDRSIMVLVEYFVIALSRHYRYWRLSTEPCRSETRYQLRMVAHLAWKSQQSSVTFRRIRNELATLITDSNRETRRLLLVQARAISGAPERPDYMFFYRDLIDCRLVQEAAVAAEAAMPGKGDYANVALSKTTRILAFVFEVATGRSPTFSRVSVGPVAKGALRTIGGSPFARFMLAFFKVVDPDLPATQITSAVERECAATRAAARKDPHHYRGLSNLL